MSTAPQAPYQTTQLDVEKFTYSQPQPNATKTITNIYMNYERSRPRIQSPLMSCPFGISVMEDKKQPQKEPGFSISAQLTTGDEKVEVFTEWLNSLDELVLAQCKKNSKPWLSRAKLSDKMAATLFKPVVKKYWDKDQLAFTGKYPPSVRFKMQRKNGKFLCGVFDHRRQPIDVNSMTNEELKAFGKGHRIRVIFEIGGIWAGAKGFGVTLRAKQIMVYPPQKLTGFGFLDDVEDALIFGSIAQADEEVHEDDDDAVEEEDEIAGDNSDEADEVDEVVENSGEQDAGTEELDVPQPTSEDQNEEEEEEQEEEQSQEAEQSQEEEEEEENSPEASPEASPEPVKKARGKKTAGKQATLAKYARKKK